MRVVTITGAALAQALTLTPSRRATPNPLGPEIRAHPLRAKPAPFQLLHPRSAQLAIGPGNARRISVIVRGERLQADAELAQVGDALRLLRFGFRAGQDRHEQRHENSE